MKTKYWAEIEKQPVLVEVEKKGWLFSLVTYGVNHRDENQKIKFTNNRYARIPNYKLHKAAPKGTNQ